MSKHEFRIVKDYYSGYEVQVKKRRKWHQISANSPGKLGINTINDTKEAEALIKRWLEKDKTGDVVAYVTAVRNK